MSIAQQLAANPHVAAKTAEQVYNQTNGEQNAPLVAVVPMSPTLQVAFSAHGKKANLKKHGKAFVAD